MRPNITPNNKQHEAWGKLQDKITEFIVYGGAAGGGKSWLGCEWLLTQSFFYPDTKYFISREGLKDIRESTLQTWYKVLRHHGIKADSLFKYNGQDHFIQFHNGSRIDLLELKYYPGDPLYERFGSLEYTAGWCEEAGENEDMAVEMISSRTGRWNNDKYGLLGKTLITCNPKKNFLYYDYYKPWKQGTLPVKKAFIPALVDDNQFGETGYKNKLDNLTGVAKERLRKGNWEYDNDDTILILYDKILDLYHNTFVKGGSKYITVDVARFGKDKSIIYVWDGWILIHIEILFHKRVDEVAVKVRELQKRFEVPNSNTIADEDGVGGGVVDILRCRGFVNNSSPLPNPITQEPEMYDNLKSQCYYKVAERVNKNGAWIKVNTREIRIEGRSVYELLNQELEQVKQKAVDSDKKKGIIPKEQVKLIIGRSPDYSDTLMMREYFELTPKKAWAIV